MKVYLCLLFFLAVLTCPVLPRAVGWERPLLVAQAVLLLVALAEHTWFLSELGLKPYQAFNIVFGGDFSGSRLNHIHVPKVILGWVLGRMSFQFDAGVPYLPFFHPAWLAAHLALFLAAALMTVVTVARARVTEPQDRWLSLALAQFLMMKNCIDGGPLNSELVAALPFLLELVLGGPVRTYAGPIWGVFWLSQLATGAPLPIPFYHYLTTVFCLTVLRGWGRNVQWLPILLVGAVLLPVARGWVHPRSRYAQSAWNMLVLQAQTLASGQVVYATLAGEFGEASVAEVEKVERAGPHRVARLRVLRPARVYELVRAFGLHPQRTPVQLGPQFPSIAVVQVREWGQRRFENRELLLPAGAGPNFLAALLPDKAIFRVVGRREPAE